jgi:L-cysteine/cystine lyase
MLFASVEDYRQRFPALHAGKVYLNYGGHGPLSQAALEAIQAAYRYEQQEGPFSRSVLDWVSDQVNYLRQTLAALFSTTLDRIALTESTTGGMNIPLWGIPWQPGNEILYSDAEHPGVRAIMTAIARRFGVTLTQIPLMHSLDPVSVVQQFLTPKTRLLLVSHVLWNNGRVLPLAQLTRVCHDHGVLIHVDAAQAAGVLPVNLPEMGVDFYAFTGHKWLCGPAGTGALYVSETAQRQMQPTFVGWRSLYSPNNHAALYEVATSGWAQLVGWRVALEEHLHLGSSQDRYSRQLRLVHGLWQELQTLPQVTCLSLEPPGSGLVGFTLAPNLNLDPKQIESALAAAGVFIRSMEEPSCLRASVHYFSTEAEISQFVEALKKILARGE